MKEVKYQDFSLKLHNQALAGNKRIPLNATLELTYRCNNKCIHCYCSLSEHDRGAAEGELSRNEIEKLFDELEGMGCLWLLITGGEPLLRPDFREIYLSAKKHGFIVTVFTNGILINDEIADLFLEFHPFAVELTMYGATKETYEKITRVKGSYVRYREGLQRLLKRKVRVKLKAMAMTMNRHEMHGMNEIADELGCHFRFDPLLHKRIDAGTYSDPERYRLSPDEVVMLDTEFPERMQAYKEFCQGTVTEGKESDTVIDCGAGSSTLHVMPDATVLPCAMLLNKGISLRKKALKEIWDSDFLCVVREKKKFCLKCDSCALQSFCEQCAGWSFVEHGRIDCEAQYLCNIAHKRAESFSFLKGWQRERYP